MSNVAKTAVQSPLAMLSKAPVTQLENFEGASPWLQFAHAMAKNMGKMTMALGEVPANGTPIWCGDSGKKFVKLNPVSFIATTHYTQGYGLFDQVGTVIDYMEADGTKPPAKWREIICALLIVDVGGVLEPTRAEFRGPKTAGFKAAIEQIALVSQPQWKDYTRENKQVYELAGKADIPQWAFLMHTGKCRFVPKTKPDGFDYDLFESSSKTISTATLKALMERMKDEAFNQQCQDCIDDLASRRESFKRK